MTRKSTPEHFWSKIDKSNDPDACWIWTGATNAHGYGWVGWHGHQRLAHRLAYELHHGGFSPELEVCHTCDNPPCCNPAHLYLGTHQDNMDDMVQKGRNSALKGEEHPRCKLNDTQVAELRRLRAEGKTYREIAPFFDISKPYYYQLTGSNKFQR